MFKIFTKSKYLVLTVLLLSFLTYTPTTFASSVQNNTLVNQQIAILITLVAQLQAPLAELQSTSVNDRNNQNSPQVDLVINAFYSYKHKVQLYETVEATINLAWGGYVSTCVVEAQYDGGSSIKNTLSFNRMIPKNDTLHRTSYFEPVTKYGLLKRVEVSCNNNEITDGAAIIIADSGKQSELSMFWNGKRVSHVENDYVTEPVALVSCMKKASSLTWTKYDYAECYWEGKLIKKG